MKNSPRDIDQADIHTHHHHFYLFTYSVNCLRSPLIFQVHRGEQREIIFLSSSSENRSRQGSFSYSYTICPLPFYLFLSGLLDRRHIESMSIYTPISPSSLHSHTCERILTITTAAAIREYIRADKKKKKKERKKTCGYVHILARIVYGANKVN